MAKKNKGGNTSKTVKNTKNEEKELIIDKETPKKEEKQEKQKEEKPTVEEIVDTTPKNKPAQKKEKKEKVPTIIPDSSEEVRPIVKSKNVMQPTQSSSVDAKAKLVEYGYHRFVNNQELKDKYPEQYNAYVKNIDMVWLLAMIDTQKELEQRIGNGEFIVKVDASELMPLQEVASMLGVELAISKSLPSLGNKDGQLEINFNESKIPEELKNEGSVNDVPDLDPKKPRTNEELAQVLNYLIRKDRNIATSIVNTVEWYRNNRIEQEETANGKLAIDAKSVEDFINEIFNIIDVTKLGIFKGLGSAIYMYTKTQGSPISAHSLLHKYMSKCGWNEEDIASTCKALIQENFRLKKCENDNLNPLEDDAIKALITNLGEDYISKVFEYSKATIDSTVKDKNTAEFNKNWANRLIQLVRQSYFNTNYKPTEDEIRMKMGQIINLYRNPMDRLEKYEEADIVAEYPQNTEKTDTTETEKKEENEKKS